MAALLEQRPEVTHAQFGARIGRGYSWVSAFLKGTRPATDIDLIVSIAKYFRVSVGYLLGETERHLDPGAATLLATWEQAGARDRAMLLQIAATFRHPTDGALDSSSAGGPEGAPRKGSAPSEPQPKKRRTGE